MLKAIIHGKAGRIEHNEDESVSWSNLFQAREDLLTSTVFERFAYLTDAVQQAMLQHWFKAHHGDIPTDSGELVNITYWPRFIHEHDIGTNQVEPDLILHFEHCNIIVEVKPPAGGDQYLWQWHKEIESFIQSDENQDKALYFLAIGRIAETNANQWANKLLNDERLPLLKGLASLKWSVVTDYIVMLTSEDNGLSNLQLSKQDRRILLDILEGLSLYGLQISPFKWSQLLANTTFSKLHLNHDALLKKRIVDAGCSLIDTSMQSLLNNSFIQLDLQSISQQVKE